MTWTRLYKIATHGNTENKPLALVITIPVRDRVMLLLIYTTFLYLVRSEFLIIRDALIHTKLFLEII